MMNKKTLQSILNHRIAVYLIAGLLVVGLSAALLTSKLTNVTKVEAATTASSASPCVGSTAPAQWKHVIVVMYENKTYNQVVGNSNVPFINSLVSKCGTSTGFCTDSKVPATCTTTQDYRSAEKFNADGTAATWSCGSCNSKQNYATLTSGKTPAALGILDDSYATLAPANTENIYSRLYAAGKTAKSYYSGPSSATPCASSNFSGAYHDAIRYYPNLGGQSSSATTLCNLNDKALGTVVDLTGSAANYSNFMNDVNSGNLPAFSLILPTNGQNMHDPGVVASQDTWLQGFLNPIFDSAQYKSGDTAIFFLYDEDTPMPNALIAPSVVAGSKVPAPSGNNISHYSMLRTWQEMLGVKDADGTFIGDSDAAPSLLSFFNGNCGTGCPVTPPPSDNPPAVTLTAPANSTTITTSPATVSANATDDGSVTKVEFYDGATLIGSDTSSPYSLSWDVSALSGSHGITAKAYDNTGHVTTSSPVSTVTISIAPPNGCTVNPSTSLGTDTTTVNVGADGVYHMWTRLWAPDSTNNSVYVKVDTGCPVNMGDSTAMAPSVWNWINYKDGATTSPADVTLTAGSHTITVIGREAGVFFDRFLLLSSTCTPSGNGENCADTTSPSTTLTAPASNATLTGSTNLTATATDNANGSGVSKVNFLVDGNQVGADVTSTTTTYQMSWSSTSVPDGTHTIQAKATDVAGNTALSSVVTVTVKNADTTPPTPPANFSTTKNTYNEVDLSWSASTDNKAVTGYNVYRTGTKIYTGTATTFNDTTVSDNTSYQYGVEAFDAAGNVSMPRTMLTVVTPLAPDTTKPTAPSNLVATASAYNKVNLTWGASTDNRAVTGYVVSRSGGTSGSVTFQTTNTSFSDTTALPSTTYTYIVNAVDAAGNASDPSNNANATTPAQPDTTKPTAPTFLAAIANTTNAQINLTWNASTDNVGVLGYKVYRRVTNSGQSFAQIGVTVASVTSFGDATVTLGTSYDYVVTAIDPSGNESAQSNQVSYALPVPPPTIETLTFSPSDDATIRKQYPAKNYGSVSTLSLNAKPVADYMMKFNVAGVKGRQVLSAQLRLYNTQGSVNGGTYTLAGSNNWTEAAVTWNTAPAAGPTIGALGSVAKGKYFVVDLVNTVNADGTYSLRVNTPSTDNAVYSSKEANNKPQLILTVQ